MEYLCFLSGGVGSWASAKLIADRHGTDNLISIFADTLTEDADLYRFLIESVAALYGASPSRSLALVNGSIPEIWEESDRKEWCKELAIAANLEIPNLWMLSDGRNIWDVFFKRRFIGNSRIDPCSEQLKRLKLREHVEQFYNPASVAAIIGYDWSEIHRFDKAVRFWRPYNLRSPLAESPYPDKHAMLAAAGIRRPRLYDDGFPHNNCGGACVRAGKSQWLLVLRVAPRLYQWNEEKEQLFRATIDPDATILKEERRGVTYPVSLKELRERAERQTELFDGDDWGGCGCFAGVA